MSVAWAAALSFIALGVMGLLPSLALAGWRFVTVPLAPVTGAVLAAVAAGAFLLLGGGFVLWSIALSVLAGGGVIAFWWRWPLKRPRLDRSRGTTPERVIVGVGLIGTVVAAALSLRALATPTAGFDTRALWALRDGWLLHSHAQALLDFKLHMFVIGQSGYPPLVSAEGALGWGLSGVHSIRVAVIIVALVNTAALLCLSAGLLAAARSAASACGARWRLVVLGAGSLSAIAIVPIAFGIQEPFITNGYADPMWALCAAGALLFGLQLEVRPEWQGVAGLLVVAAGMSKQEGLFTAVCLIVLITIRRLAAARARREQLVVLVAPVIELAALSWWWLAIHLTGSRDVSSPLAPTSTMGHRARAVLHGFSPSLHVLILAGAIAVLGGLALRRPRRRAGLGNDAWAWLGLAAGLSVVSLVLITGQAPVVPWIAGSVHRVTQYPAIAGWLIIGVWGITAASGLESEPADEERST